MSLGGYVVDLEQVGKQMCFFIIPCQAAALKQCLFPLYLYTFPFFLPDKIPNLTIFVWGTSKLMMILTQMTEMATMTMIYWFVPPEAVSHVDGDNKDMLRIAAKMMMIYWFVPRPLSVSFLFCATQARLNANQTDKYSFLGS